MHILIALFIALIPLDALAQTAASGDLIKWAQHVREQLKAIPQLVFAFMQLVGLICGAKTFTTVKEMADDGRDPELAKKSLLYFFAAVCLFGFPTLMGIGTQTFFDTPPQKNPTLIIR